MIRLTILLLLSALVLSCNKKQPPIIEFIKAEPNSVYPGDTVVLNCEANPGDDHDLYLHFAWSAHEGTFYNPTDPVGSTHYWIAPKKPGPHYISLTVSDPDFSVTDSVLVMVMDTMGTFTDVRDGHEYKWVKIGSQIWMAENLAYLPAVSSWDTGIDTADFYYVYGYVGTNVAEAKMWSHFQLFGALYSWKAARIVCPDGWRLPSDDDWKTLEKRLGMSESDANSLWLRNSGLIGKKLKSSSEWDSTGNGDNSSRLNCFPGGLRDNQGFISMGASAYFWTSTPDLFTRNVLGRWLSYHEDGVYRASYYRWHGLSVRCVKD